MTFLSCTRSAALFAILLLAGQSDAFAPVATSSRRVVTIRESTVDEPAVSPEPPTVKPPMPSAPKEVGGALVAINDSTVEFTAGLAGGLAGLVIGGPVVGLIAAAATNYVSRTKEESGEAAVIINAVSTKSIEVYNYLAKVDAKYQVLDNAKSKLESALADLKKSDSMSAETQSTIAKVEEALEKTTSRIAELNEEYDLVGAGVLALGVIGDIVQKTVKKASELNEEYKLTDKAIEALQTAVSKAKDAAASK